MQLIRRNDSYHLHLVIDQHGELIVVDDRKHDYHDVVDAATEVVIPIKIDLK